jgi:ABC-type sulfate transport system permease subunit
VGLNGVVGAIRRRLGALGAVTAVEHVLQPKSKALTRMLESAIKEKMKSDKEFSADLIEVAASNNVLLKDNIKETLTKGTAELRAAGWINTKDEKALLNAYTSRG